MKIFDHYAQYYDLLYAGKDYAAEANYVYSLIEKFNPDARSVLDIGCGTGGHGFHFAERGCDVTGIDLSPSMVSLAEQKKQQMGLTNISFQQGDIQTLELAREFDVVVSLFHVLNYLTKNSEITRGFANAAKHIRSAGILIFDSWYGPAVLSDLPKVGVRRFENDRIKVTRLVEPGLHPNRNAVDVNYEIIVQEKASESVATIKETHAVRYFFKPEIEQVLESVGVDLLVAEEWLTGKEPGLSTFGVCFVGRKR